METKILDGKRVGAQIQNEVAEEIVELKKRGITPGLRVIWIGDNPASAVYVRNKARTSESLGMDGAFVHLPKSTTTEQLLREIGKLNRDDEVDGILIQLPLPSHIDEERVLVAVHPAKDVDGFHPVNVGKLASGRGVLAPCTPTGIIELLRREQIPFKGAHAVVVGRSNIVGKPMAMLLLQEHCTVTICHSRTRDLDEVCRSADILVAAVGRKELITKNSIKPGAVVIDVGMNRVETHEELVRLFGEGSSREAGFAKRGYTLIGDVHPRDPIGIASAVTPVPGGVGPLTIALLMKNTVLACKSRRAIETQASQRD